jgi:hypothetical protein
VRTPLPVAGPWEAQYGERFNFKPFNGRVYGTDPRHHTYVSLREAPHPWLVIMVAALPNAGRVQAYLPVGWYEQATLVTARDLPQRPEYSEDPNFPRFQNGAPFCYKMSADAAQAYVIPVDRRSAFPQNSYDARPKRADPFWVHHETVCEMSRKDRELA